MDKIKFYKFEKSSYLKDHLLRCSSQRVAIYICPFRIIILLQIRGALLRSVFAAGKPNIAVYSSLLLRVPRATSSSWFMCHVINKVISQAIGWNEISEKLPGRTDVQCRARWKNHLQPDLVKGPWTKEEDDL